MLDHLSRLIHQFFARQAREIDFVLMEAMAHYRCGPEQLAVQYELKGMVEVVTVLGPKRPVARPQFKQLRFELAPDERIRQCID